MIRSVVTRGLASVFCLQIANALHTWVDVVHDSPVVFAEMAEFATVNMTETTADANKGAFEEEDCMSVPTEDQRIDNADEKEHEDEDEDEDEEPSLLEEDADDTDEENDEETVLDDDDEDEIENIADDEDDESDDEDVETDEEEDEDWEEDENDDEIDQNDDDD